MSIPLKDLIERHAGGVLGTYMYIYLNIYPFSVDLCTYLFFYIMSFL